MMSRETKEEYTFTCPECDEALEVNGSMKDALIERGCVICGAGVTTDAFTNPTSANSS
ncbi:hypothetical protein G3I44_15545 [Halogeometricum borinquense]|uniref:Zinc ribbon domain-containing protein n=3 Tax=Halogeometricum borinquense TaxID=60847 RepID=L9ULC0_HALBP|nr:hypothetical protein [Halogeometricum borinquense]ELY25522.1 hypothetical protein C499_13595 [Halogeometricum borinquense DSM 11551]QIB72805.1 hypothetical protein G3I44_15545 [Halogeometricum borinquense]